jgi:hypothetical protein
VTKIAKKFVSVCILFAFFAGLMMTTHAGNAAPISANATTALVASSTSGLGWGGFILSTSSAQSTLTDLHSHGYTSLRYEAWAPFLSGSRSHLINYAVLDYIVKTAATMGITIIIDPIHNYPESTCYTLQSHFSQWQSQLVAVGKRYNSAQNVILECVNEYKLSDAPQKFQTIVNTLRANGITLPLQFNYMWGTVAALKPPKDPLNKISIGHHVYGERDTDASYMKSGETWIQYCTRIGLEAREKRMFTDSTQTCWFGYALAHGTKVLCTEIGGSSRNTPVMTPYNVAFVMRTLEYAKMYGVGIDCFRVGDCSNIQQYESLAQQWFHRSFFSP